MTAISDALDGQVALVTGASSGIGEATAELLADEGASIVLAARRSEDLNALADRIETAGGDALPVETDVTDEDQIRELIDTVEEEYGRLDVLINNAGVMLLSPIESADTDDWEQMLDVNVLGLMDTTQAALPLLKESEAGHVVNLSSVAGRKAYAGSGAYNASKFGITAFSEALRQETLDDDIRVTSIEPGAVDTELQEHIPDEDAREENEEMLESMTPLEGEDIARAIRYAVTQPAHVDVNEILIRPTEQEL